VSKEPADVDGVFRSVHHIGISVANLDRAVAFWEGLVGAPAHDRRAIEAPFIGQMLGYPGAKIEIAWVDLLGEEHWSWSSTTTVRSQRTSEVRHIPALRISVWELTTSTGRWTGRWRSAHSSSARGPSRFLEARTRVRDTSMFPTRTESASNCVNRPVTPSKWHATWMAFLALRETTGAVW
jgi:hypothetical protein